MPKFAFDKAHDGTVGSFADIEEPAPPERVQSPQGILVSGTALSNLNAIGLAGDIGLLIQRFIHSPTSKTNLERRHPEGNDDLETALHGLGLDPDQEAELRHRIRELVWERRTEGGTAK
jgi:hypothetical protein